MTVDIQAGGTDQRVTGVGCVTADLGDLRVTVTPAGIEVAYLNGDDDPAAWLEPDELRRMATGQARLTGGR